MGLEKPNSGLEPGETNSGSDLDSDETFQISRNLGLDIDENVCLLDSQLCLEQKKIVLTRIPLAPFLEIIHEYLFERSNMGYVNII